MDHIFVRTVLKQSAEKAKHFVIKWAENKLKHERGTVDMQFALMAERERKIPPNENGRKALRQE